MQVGLFVSMHVIGIDMGGTKIFGSVVDKKGKCVLKHRRSTEAKKGRRQVIANLVEVILHLKRESKKPVKAVGISLPGFVDDAGKLVFAGGTLTSLKGVNLKRELERKVKLPVMIENDANCFALAEAVYGAGKSGKVVVGVIWGTGIGGGIVVDKKIYSGAFGGAGEFGHMAVEPSGKGKKCVYGNYVCLERLASGKNIERMYREKGGKLKGAHPGEIYESKERVAKEVINSAVHYLGVGIGTLVNVLNPDVVVLGGGVSNMPQKVYAQLKKEVQKYSLPILSKNVRIVRHKISDAAGAIGAAALAFQR